MESLSNQNDDSPGSSGDGAWAKIWKLNVPPKVKVFWWRVVHEFLPAKDILNRRHIEPSSCCDTCGAEKETIRHILIECTIAKRFWAEVRVLTGVKLPSLHAATWATDLISGVCSDKNRGIFIVGMYSLWMQRNNRRHGAPVQSVRGAVQWAVDLAHDLWLMHEPKLQVPVPVPRPGWKLSETSWVKCNTDGAFCVEKRWGATGVVLRDHHGSFVAGRAQWYKHGLDALTMEALAVRDGLALAHNKGIQRLQLETDSQELVKLWTTDTDHRSRIGPVIREAREISLIFVDFKLFYSRRSCNRVAHTLAKQVSEDRRLVEWHETPTCVRNLITEDCSPGNSDE